MSGLTATQLAEALSLSKGRISQYVSGGQLDNCFVGVGRNRRFNLESCKEALGRNLDQGQMLGNGRATKKRLAAIEGDQPQRDSGPEMDDLLPKRAGATPLKNDDPDLYELARTQIAVENARRARRNNAAEEGTLVLANVVAQQTAKMISQEVAEFETFLRDGARRVADEMGIDNKLVRQVLVNAWRDHRKARAEVLARVATSATMTEEEKEGDF